MTAKARSVSIFGREPRTHLLTTKNQLLTDEDIGCPIPNVPESVFGEYNWFLSSIRFGRILSIAYNTLFSVSARLKPREATLAAIEHIRTLLEHWRFQIPPDFRPGTDEPIRLTTEASTATKFVVLRTQHGYYHLLIALERLTILHLDSTDKKTAERSKLTLMKTARRVIELSKFIDIGPQTPIL